MGKRNFEGLVKIPEERPAKGELKKHNAEKGKRFVFFDKKNLPEANMYVIAREMVGITEPYQAAEPREHSVDAFMIFMGLGEDLKGIKVEITLDEKRKVYESPVGVYIPRQTMNSYKVLEGSGIYMKIVLAPMGDYNAVTT